MHGETSQQISREEKRGKKNLQIVKLNPAKIGENGRSGSCFTKEKCIREGKTALMFLTLQALQDASFIRSLVY